MAFSAGRLDVFPDEVYSPSVALEGQTPDDRLVASLLAREPGSWERLLEVHGGVIAGSCRRALAHAGLPASQAEIADAFAEAVGTLLENDQRLLRRHRLGTPLGAYLSVIAYTCTRRHARRPSPPLLDEDEPPGQDLAALGLEAAERASRLREALGSLPSRDAEALRLFHLEGLRYAEIAARTGIPEGQVGMLLARARERLRQSLGEDFLESV